MVMRKKKMKRNKSGQFSCNVYVFYELPKESLEVHQVECGEQKPQRVNRSGLAETDKPPYKKTSDQNKKRTTTFDISFPKSLTLEEQSAISKMMSKMDEEDALNLFDDFVKRLSRKHDPIANPVGYFYWLIKTHKDGGNVSQTKIDKGKKERIQKQLEQFKLESELARDELFEKHGVKL